MVNKEFRRRRRKIATSLHLFLLLSRYKLVLVQLVKLVLVIQPSIVQMIYSFASFGASVDNVYQDIYLAVNFYEILKFADLYWNHAIKAASQRKQYFSRDELRHVLALLV